eukprot:COSAG02_NODE_2747_length_8108_cov_3.195405_1_plen_314_part_00
MSGSALPLGRPVPVGHTSFSWTEGANATTPDGHTAYSWKPTNGSGGGQGSLADRAAKLREDRRQPGSGARQSGSLADRARVMKAQRSRRPDTGNGTVGVEAAAVSTADSVSDRLAALVAGIAECEARLVALEGGGPSTTAGVAGDTQAPGFFPADLHWLRFGNRGGTAVGPSIPLTKPAPTHNSKEEQLRLAADRRQAADRRAAVAREAQAAARSAATHIPQQHLAPGQLVQEGHKQQISADRATSASAAPAESAQSNTDSAPKPAAAVGSTQPVASGTAAAEGQDPVASMRSCVIGSVAAAALALAGMRLLQ